MNKGTVVKVLHAKITVEDAKRFLIYNQCCVYHQAVAESILRRALQQYYDLLSVCRQQEGKG